MGLSASGTIINPNFTKSTEALFASYGRIARDLASSLHQITNFVQNSFSPKNRYGFSINNERITEKLDFRTKKDGILSVAVSQHETDYDFFTSDMRLENDTVVNAFNHYVRHCTDLELKKLAEYYRIFLMGLAKGTLYGNITTDDGLLIIDIGKYDSDFNQIHVSITMNYIIWKQ